jgi:hypothetical protein
MILEYKYYSQTPSEYTLIYELANNMSTDSSGSAYTYNVPTGIMDTMKQNGVSMSSWNGGLGNVYSTWADYQGDIDYNYPVLVNLYGSQVTTTAYPNGFGNHSVCGMGYQIYSNRSVVMIKKKIFSLILLTIILISVIMVIVIYYFVKSDNRNIPFLPVSANDINVIQLNGSTTRNATENEKIQIINWLNNIKKYDRKISIPKYGNGKPQKPNIQLFSKNNSDTNLFYILKVDNNIMISKPFSTVGYIVNQQNLYNLLKQFE